MLCLPSGAPNPKVRGRGRLRNFRKPSWATRAQDDDHNQPSQDDSRQEFNLQMFPHICENIYDNTPLPRENLRLVSQEFKRLVDKDITWHMGITTPCSREALERDAIPPQKCMDLSGERDSTGHFDWESYRGPPLFFQVGLASKYATARLIPDGQFVGGGNSDDFQSTRVLDLVLPPNREDWSIPSLPERISILRIIPCGWEGEASVISRASRTVKADTVVAFTRPREHLFDSIPLFGHAFGQRRTVVNVGIPCPPELITGIHPPPLRPEDPLHIHWMKSEILDVLEECVYIFDEDWLNWTGGTQSNIKLLSASDDDIERCNGLRPNFKANEVMIDEDDGLGFLNSRFTHHNLLGPVMHTFTKAIGTSQNPVRLVFVGAASFSSAALGLHEPCQYESFIKDPHTPATFKNTHYALVQRRLRAAILWRSCLMRPYSPDKWVSHEEMLRRVHHLVEFRTHKEHRAKVVDYQYRAETVGYEWMGLGKPEVKPHNKCKYCGKSSTVRDR